MPENLESRKEWLLVVVLVTSFSLCLLVIHWHFGKLSSCQQMEETTVLYHNKWKERDIMQVL